MRKILKTIRKPKPPKELSEKEKRLVEDDEKMLKIVRNTWDNYKSISRIEDHLKLCRVSFISNYGRIFRDGYSSNKLDALWLQVTGQKFIRYKHNEE